MSPMEAADESQRAREAGAGAGESRDESFAIKASSPAAASRLQWIRELLGIADRAEYGRRREAVAQALKLSERSVDRLVRQGRRDGIASLVRRGRSDRGVHRVSQAWQEFRVGDPFVQFGIMTGLKAF